MELTNVNVKMMATLWENTYRMMVTDQNNNYLASARLIVSIPLPPEALPEGAPEVEPQLTVLVEDGVMSSDDIIQFETLLSAKLREKFQYKINTLFFFYPSPEDVLSKQ